MKKGKGKNHGLLPNSLKIISSCLKTVSTNASTVASTVRSAGASVAASITTPASEDQKDQVTWAGFDTLELDPQILRRVLLLGYLDGFQVLDVDDASAFKELVSRRDGPVSFLQIQPTPAKSNVHEGFKKSLPLLLVVAGEESSIPSLDQNRSHLGSQSGNGFNPANAVRFYSLKSHSYVHILRFRSAVCMVRCSSHIVAVSLVTQIYCFDAATLENKFSVLTYPVPQMSGNGTIGVNVGYGPMAVGSRWLAYASNTPLVSNTGCITPQNFSPSQGVSPSSSPSNGGLVARYAMESGKQLAAGIVNLGDKGYKTWSNYCQEHLPDCSNSPVSPNPVWNVGRLAGKDTDNAGMVIVKDFVSRAVISHFKAHSSQLSALCFDPSGNLLVTASIHGNNLNIFRIMPYYSRKSSGCQIFDWKSSHVHLYKLHRGITSAMIQDICFSNYSQWVAIVSSKGTCHIFILSPFGGDPGFRILNSQNEESSLIPVLSLPWWSTSSFMINQQSFPPPPPVSLSVVSRIKYSSFGWLTSLNSAAAPTIGKVFVPSGAVAAIFHNSLFHSLKHDLDSLAHSLEHLLVYTPSGHVVQHQLLPSMGPEPSLSGSRTHSASFMHVHEDELRLKVEPIQWWDVCRRLDFQEREEPICGSFFNRQDNTETAQNRVCSDDNSNSGQNYSEKLQEISHLFISNAEVHISSGRLPIWQNAKICIFVMDSPRINNQTGGEFEVENFPVHEIEVRRKELLPIFYHSHSLKSGWNDRGHVVGQYHISASLEPHQAEDRIPEEIVIICHSKPASLSSTESSDGGSSRMENMIDLDQMNCEKSYTPFGQTLNEIFTGGKENQSIIPIAKSQNILLIQSKESKIVDSHRNLCLMESVLPSPEVSSGTPSVNTVDLGHMSIVASDFSGLQIMNEDIADKKGEDGEGDHLLGAIFAFSEEGRDMPSDRRSSKKDASRVQMFSHFHYPTVKWKKVRLRFWFGELWEEMSSYTSLCLFSRLYSPEDMGMK